eukprot:scaffold1118_cov135-Cylindrotheca_fusiformis.AAC.10
MKSPTRRSTGNSGQSTDPGEEPPQPYSPVNRMPDPDEELSLFNSDFDEEAHVRAVMSMTAPRGERLTPGSVPAHIQSGQQEQDSFYLEEAEPANENPIVAQLAHDDVDDIAARVSERLERRMTEQLKREVEARMALERSNQVMAEQLAANERATTESYDEQVPPRQPPSQTSEIQQAEEALVLEDYDDNFKVCGVRRTCWGLILTTVFLLMVGGLTSFLLYFTDNETSDTSQMEIPEPTVSPTVGFSTQSRWLEIMDRIGPVISTDSSDDPTSIFRDQSTAQYRAFNWLAKTDEYGANDLDSISDQELVDRYALAVLYYADLGMTWKKQLNFLEPVSVCRWNNGIDSKDENAAGVYCAENEVTFLQIVDNGLKGELPSELGLLTNLVHLNLDRNVLFGEVPGLAKLKALEVLWLSSNNFVGNIPAEMAQLTSLASLDLEDNSLSGTLPFELASLSNLFFLGLRLNSFEGELPDQLWERLSNLRFLDLEANQFQKTIPSQLGLLTGLESLYLEKNRFTGTLPSELGQLQNLAEFLLYGNRLTGPVPDEFSALSSLQYFWIHGTDLSGNIDDIFCSGSFVQSLSADCYGDPLQITCTCCSQCCNPFGENCRQNL